MKSIEYDSDRTVDSTENNEYNEGLRDENLLEENLLDTEIPIDDEIPEALRETREKDRPLYDEDGYRAND